jgi:hypothetical protein
MQVEFVFVGSETSEVFRFPDTLTTHEIEQYFQDWIRRPERVNNNETHGVEV